MSTKTTQPPRGQLNDTILDTPLPPLPDDTKAAARRFAIATAQHQGWADETSDVLDMLGVA